MLSAVQGPGSANISWTLAFSGGLPVEGFHIEFRRNDSLVWHRGALVTEEEEFGALLTNGGGINADSMVVPANRRFQIVGGLEAEELYMFRVAGSNGLGRGEFVATEELLLSHHTGVPSPPAQPQIIGWRDDSVTINTTLHKFGSELDFSLRSILVLNGTVVSADDVGVSLPGNYSLGEGVELTMTNISYRGDLRFAVIASNHLGSSLASELSLRGKVISN